MQHTGHTVSRRYAAEEGRYAPGRYAAVVVVLVNYSDLEKRLQILPIYLVRSNNTKNLRSRRLRGCL